MASRNLFGAVCLAIALGALGCGDDEKDGQASGKVVTGDALESCLTEEGLDVERGEPAPIRFNSGPVTPAAVLVEGADDFPRSEILVLEPQDAVSFDRSLPAGVKEDTRFGANVVVLVTDVGPVGDVRLVVPGDVRRALNACVD